MSKRVVAFLYMWLHHHHAPVPPQSATVVANNLNPSSLHRAHALRNPVYLNTTGTGPPSIISRLQAHVLHLPLH